MLVLSRKSGEKIVLPGLDVVLTVLNVDGGKVRLGITAPPDVTIYRDEVWQRIVDKAAARTADSASAHS